MTQRGDDLYLVDLIEAGEAIAHILQDHDRRALDENVLFRSAVLWNLFQIGESASNLSSSARASFEHVPWDAIRGLRNRLAHGYFSIEHDRIWEIVQKDVPLLKERAEQQLAEKFPVVWRQLVKRRGGP